MAGVTDAQVIEVAAHVASKLFTNIIGIVSQVTVDMPAQPNLPKA